MKNILFKNNKYNKYLLFLLFFSILPFSIFGFVQLTSYGGGLKWSGAFPVIPVKYNPAGIGFNMTSDEVDKSIRDSFTLWSFAGTQAHFSFMLSGTNTNSIVAVPNVTACDYNFANAALQMENTILASNVPDSDQCNTRLRALPQPGMA